MHLEHGQLCLHVQKLFFWVSLVIFAFLVPNHYENRVFWGFWKLDFQLFGLNNVGLFFAQQHTKIKKQKKMFSRVSLPFFPFPFFLWLSVCLCIISFLSFLPSFLFLLSLVPSFVVACPRTPKYWLQKNSFCFQCFFAHFSFHFLSLTFVLSFCLSFLFLPSFLSLPSFLLFSSFFHSFLLSFPSFASKEKEERERERERERDRRERERERARRKMRKSKEEKTN